MLDDLDYEKYSEILQYLSSSAQISCQIWDIQIPARYPTRYPATFSARYPAGYLATYVAGYLATYQIFKLQLEILKYFGNVLNFDVPTFTKLKK